jgi:hypothetical protein
MLYSIGVEVLRFVPRDIEWCAVAFGRYETPWQPSGGDGGRCAYVSGLRGWRRENEAPLAVPTISKIAPDMYVRCAVPEWFRRGGDLEELLTEAGVLDWLSDNGGESLLEG